MKQYGTTDRLDLGGGRLGSLVYVHIDKKELERYLAVSEGRLGDLEDGLAELKAACVEKTAGKFLKEKMDESDGTYPKRREESFHDLQGLVKKGPKHWPDAIEEAVYYCSLPLKRRGWKRERLNRLKQVLPAVSECLANIDELVTTAKYGVTAYRKQAQRLKDAVKSVQSDQEGKILAGYEIEAISGEMDACMERSEKYYKTALHAYASATRDDVSKSRIGEVETREVRKCLDEIAGLKSKESAKRRKEAELMVRLATEHPGL